MGLQVKSITNLQTVLSQMAFDYEIEVHLKNGDVIKGCIRAQAHPKDSDGNYCHGLSVGRQRTRTVLYLEIESTHSGNLFGGTITFLSDEQSRSINEVVAAEGEMELLESGTPIHAVLSPTSA